MYDFIIRKPTIVDGTGTPGYVADVAVVGGEIVEIAEDIPVKSEAVVLAEGLVLTPGFIDVQNHSDSYWSMFDNPGLDSMLLQGFTSILVGHCGASLAPLLSPEAVKSMQKWHNLSGTNVDWSSFAELSNTLAKQKFGVNIGSLVGYSTIRRGLVGSAPRSLTTDETQVLASQLAQSMRSGAFGLSCGLGYSHELHASELEIYEMAKVVASAGGLLSVHLRNEAEGLSTSVEEALDIAGRSGVKLKISHLKIRGEANWSGLGQVLDRLEDAVHRGTSVCFDVYPYETTWQPLFTYLPKWSTDGGREAMLLTLNDPLQVKKILNYLQNSGVNLHSLVVASCSYNLRVVSKTIGQIAANMGVSSEEAIIELLKNGGSEVLVFDACLSEPQVTELLAHPLAVVATDGGGFSAGYATAHHGRLMHPRCFGSSAMFFSRMKSKGAIKFETAVSKLTARPAEVWGLPNRGTLAVGKKADMVLLDPLKLRDLATLQNPFRSPEGIEKVWVNGVLAVESGVVTGLKSGLFLRKN